MTSPAYVVRLILETDFTKPIATHPLHAVGPLGTVRTDSDLLTNVDAATPLAIRRKDSFGELGAKPANQNRSRTPDGRLEGTGKKKAKAFESESDLAIFGRLRGPTIGTLQVTPELHKIREEEEPINTSIHNQQTSRKTGEKFPTLLGGQRPNI